MDKFTTINTTIATITTTHRANRNNSFSKIKSSWILITTVLIIISTFTNVSSHKLPDDSLSEESGDYSDDNLHSLTQVPVRKEENKIKSNLKSDINAFIELVPVNEVREKIIYFYNTDKDYLQTYEYLNGKEFFTMRKKLFDVREVKEFESFLNNIGLNIKEILYKFDDLLGITKLKPQLNRNNSQSLSTQTNRGLYGLLEDVLALLPQDEIFILFFEKLDSSKEFIKFVENIGSDEFGRRFDSLKKSGELKKILADLQKHKIDIRKIIELVKSFFIFGTF